MSVLECLSSYQHFTFVMLFADSDYWKGGAEIHIAAVKPNKKNRPTKLMLHTVRCLTIYTH